jgi:hypothetical protein
MAHSTKSLTYFGDLILAKYIQTVKTLQHSLHH